MKLQILFMASLWNRSGEWLAIKGIWSFSSDQVGAHFKALDEADLVALALFKILEIFFISNFPAGSEEILLPLSMCIECLQANVKKWSSGKWKPCQDQ